ncbi:copper amine oxidase [Exophiala viscosa]|uniref:Amine oxidase n=1 Tax=Exophiala viscosa TaxID=2486360 RepID=A0AAN6DTM1_9EURO|nr:copper amine oxidase [Exophiala viscosa]
MAAIHPLDPIQPQEIRNAVLLLQKRFPQATIRFKVIDMFEPPKNEVFAHIQMGKKPSGSSDRRAQIYFHRDKSSVMSKAIVNVSQATVEKVEDLPDVQGPVDLEEWEAVHDACNSHPKVQEEIAKLRLPPGAKVINDPWAFGTDNVEERRRLFQCYMYIVLSDDPESNHYSIPAPISPVFDANTLELLWIDRLPLGSGSEADQETQPWLPTKPIEYSASILGDAYFRRDLKPLQIVQPEGPSFSVEKNIISWQKWRFHLGWTLREGPVIQNVTYDGRSLFYRVSMSEMTVPYGDPRTPYHRKQAFDLGDSGFGIMSNSLRLGCDCLGLIKYFDGWRCTSKGEPVLMKNVVCMHEVDNGIGWKHTNYRNGETSVVRDRQLVIQCTATLANYEYILAFVFDQAANLRVEVRATGIVSTMPIRSGIHSDWGTVVAPGVLAVHHQHIFSVRIDPALDGQANSILYEDCVPLADPESDPFGCAFKVQSNTITKPGGYELDLTKARTYKIVNSAYHNPISKKPVSYKLHALPSQMMMMGEKGFNRKRALFATKPIWVTKYGDDELYAAGEFTNQSREDTGLAVWTKRPDLVSDEDVVLWHTFAITHVTRPEDFPVMPHEGMSIMLKPSNFFESNPSNDVPRSSQAVHHSARL